MLFKKKINEIKIKYQKKELPITKKYEFQLSYSGTRTLLEPTFKAITLKNNSTEI